MGSVVSHTRCMYSSEYQTMSKDRKGNDIAGDVCLLVSWVLVGRQRVMKEMHHGGGRSRRDIYI